MVAIGLPLSSINLTLIGVLLLLSTFNLKSVVEGFGATVILNTSLFITVTLGLFATGTTVVFETATVSAATRAVAVGAAVPTLNPLCTTRFPPPRFFISVLVDIQLLE